MYRFKQIGSTVLIGAGIGLFFTSAWAQGDKEKVFECRRTEQAINIDGKANETAWKSAQKIEPFLQPWEKPSREATTQTRAKLLWDDTYLYFYAELDDTDLQAVVKEQDGRLWEDDVFELFFKPHTDQPGYYEFQVNALGSKLDIFFPQREKDGYEKYRSVDPFKMMAKVTLKGSLNKDSDEDKGWAVEGRIPWKDFAHTGGAPKLNDVWRFTLCRYDYSKDFKSGKELSVSAPKMEKSFHGHEHYAPLKFTGPWNPRTGLPKRLQNVKGFAGSRIIGSPDPPLPYKVEKVFPDLKVSNLISFKFEPGSGRIVYINQPTGFKGTRLNRYDPKTKKSEVLMNAEEMIYNLEFHPDYSNNRQLFLSGFGPTTAERENKRVKVVRLKLDREITEPLEFEGGDTIIEWPCNGHTGGAMAFDSDGMFYVTTGDGTSDSDGYLSGQDLTRLYAKVLRIDIEHPDPGKAYSIPKDNPFLNHKGARPETFAYGFRNPWRMHWDKNLDRLWVGQNGQDRLEQAYLVERGANYGWSVYEGSRIFYANRKRGPTPISPPTVEHDHGESRSLTGGVVIYDGKKYPDLKGAYIYGDYSTGKIWAAKHDGKKLLWDKEIADTPLGITDFVVDPQSGAMLISDYRSEKVGGGLYRLIPNPPPAPNTPDFPRKLSDTGLFSSVSKHQVEPALLPYDVIIPQWLDGAKVSRYLKLPENNTHIGFGQERGWDFPDGTVVLQTISIGNDDKQRRVETRLMVKQEKEWAAYSYAWNDEQNDALLVESAGKELQIDGRKWRIPSRAECLVCHSRAAKFVLGLQTEQMNRDKAYTHDFTANQLEVIDRLGFFQKPGGKNPISLMSKSLDTYPRFTAPNDPTADLNHRARSYLHATCAHCHVGSGGGNSTMDLRSTVDDEKMDVFGSIPHHGDQELGADARIVKPGDPVKSVMFNRVSKIGPGRMPPMGSETPDARAVGLLLQWILAKKAEGE